jgi:hypothetical protein
MKNKDSELIEALITMKIKNKAEELGIEFKVKHSIKEGLDDLLVRVKSDFPKPTEKSSEEDIKAFKEMYKKQQEFVNHASDVVVGEYFNSIRFTYPTRL